MAEGISSMVLQDKVVPEDQIMVVEDKEREQSEAAEEEEVGLMGMVVVAVMVLSVEALVGLIMEAV